VFFSMARDGLFPEFATKVHKKFGTPYITTIITGVVCALAGGLLPIGVLGHLVSIGTLFAFVLVSLGIIILRRVSPDVPRPFRTPGVPWVPIAGAVICLAQMVGLPAATWERLFIWLAIGLTIYVSYGARREGRT
jgi:APA family basic amino acid/polyamine antiporter